MSNTNMSRYSSNTNSNVVEKLAEVIESIDSKNPSASDSLIVLSFLEKTYNITSLGQSFSHFATVNDHDALAVLNHNLAKLITYSNKHIDLQPFASNLIKEIISIFNIKVFFRCLNNNRNKITNPALRLMSSIVIFKNGAMVDDFLENFDLTLKVLPNLLLPSKQELADPSKSSKSSVRSYFIKFWIDLCTYSNAFARKDLLNNNRKIITNWFKYIATHDSTETLKYTLRFLDTMIILEPSYKKMTKCKILSDWVLMKLVELYKVSDVRDLVHEFLTRLTTDNKVGLVFYNDKSWFTLSDEGVSVTIGGQSFRILNKIIYNLLTHLKPYNDDKQLDLAVSILSEVPELIPVYNYHCYHTTGAHDPKLTSFFIGQSLLLSNILQLTIPQAFIKTVHSQIRGAESGSTKALTLSSSHLIEIICPSQLTRAALTKCLTNDSFLIKHLASELIIASFQKLEKLNNILSYSDSSMYNSIKSELIELLQRKLPDLSAVVGALNEAQKNQAYNKFLLLNCLSVIQHYDTFFNQSTSLNLPSMSLQNVENFKGIDLVNLDIYLKLNSNSQNKWWTITKGMKNSLFTSILKLPHQLKTHTMDSYVIDVISNLADKTLIFNDFKTTPILANPSYALLYSLSQFSGYVKEDFEIDKICGVLDEAVSRCVRTPYKYIDLATKFKAPNGHPVSPLYVSILEQSKFVKEPSQVLIWLRLLTRYLYIIGESSESLKLISSEYANEDLFDFKSEKELSGFFDTFYKSVPKSEDVPLFEIVSNYPSNKLEKQLESKVPTSDLDILAILRRVSLIIQDESLKIGQVKDILVQLLSKVGNYFTQKINNIEINTQNLNLFETKYWDELYAVISDLEAKQSNEKKDFVAKLLNEIFYTLDEESGDEEDVFKFYFKSVSSLLEVVTDSSNPDVVDILCDSLWVLSNESVALYLQKCGNSLVKNTLLKIAITKKVHLEPNQFVELSTILDSSNYEYFVTLSENVLFKITEVETILNKVLNAGSEFYYSILVKILLSNTGFLTEVFPTIVSSANDIICSIQGLDFLFAVNSQKSDESVSKLVKESSLEGLKSYLSSVETDEVRIRSYMKALSSSDSESTSELIKGLLEHESFKNNADLVFSNEFVELLFTSPAEELLKVWYYRGILYITKMFAENEYLPSSFFEFLSSLDKIILKYPIWKYVPRGILNSQLEVILSSKWVTNESTLKYTNLVLMSGSKNVVEFDKHLQIFLNNEHNILDYVESSKSKAYSALILYHLFNFNISKVANWSLLFKVLKLYNGTLSSEDLILKSIILEFEKSMGQSWANYITSWEFIDESTVGDTSKFISDTPGTTGLNISLSRKIVNYSINNFVGSAESFKLPQLSHSINSSGDNWNSLINFIDHNLVVLSNLGPIYDNEFLMLLIVSNDELFQFKESEVDIDIKKLLESSLLQFIYINLANFDSDIVRISKRILSSCLLSIETQIKAFAELKESKEKSETQSAITHLTSFKDRSAFKVFLGNTLHTLEDPEMQLTPLELVFSSHLIPILSNPGHFLYEKTFRYILGGSKFRLEVPLYKSILLNFTSDIHLKSSTSDQPDFYKQLQWFILTLTKSLTSSSDLKLLNRGGILDNILNLTSSPFLPSSLQSELQNFVTKVLELPNGSDLLVRSYGLLGFLELKKNKKIAELNNGSKITKDKVAHNSELLKIQTLAVCAETGANSNGSDKRVREWCGDELERNVKRILH